MHRVLGFLRYVLIMLLIYAPLICLRYCELRAELAGRPHLTSGERMILRHVAGLAAPAPDQPEHGQHAPLNELAIMLIAATEYVIPGPLLLLAVLIWRIRQMPFMDVGPVLFDTVTPPPRPQPASRTSLA